MPKQAGLQLYRIPRAACVSSKVIQLLMRQKFLRSDVSLQLPPTLIAKGKFDMLQLFGSY